MKTVINSSQNAVLELAKRGIYSFQVLIVGIAIPFLFLFGISNASQKKIDENQVKKASNTNSLSSDHEIGVYIPKI